MKYVLLFWLVLLIQFNTHGAITFAMQETSVQFQPKLLTVDANEGIALADVNNDGKTDVIAGRNWYLAPEFTSRPVRTIDDWNGYVQSNGDFVTDVDGDGFVDVVAGSFLPTEVHWFKNPGTEALKLGQQFRRQLLRDTKLSSNEGSELRDLDNDGQPEWITNSWKPTTPVVVWKFAKSRNGRPTLLRHVVGTEGQFHGMGFGDVNNDGREDIVFANGWYERPAKDIWKKKWKHHPDWEMGETSPIEVRDLNGDGVNDLIWGKGHDFGLYWWQGVKAKPGAKLQFIKHKIDDRYSQAHAIHFVDLDGDGTDELVTGKRLRAHNGKDPGGNDKPCLYYYRWNQSSLNFERHVIDEGHIGTGLQIRSADLNADGKVDLAVAGKDGTWILFQK